MRHVVVWIFAIACAVACGCAPASVGSFTGDEADSGVGSDAEPESGARGSDDREPAAVDPPPGAGAETCAGMVEAAPYADHVTNAELVDPPSCDGCPGSFTGLEALDVPLAPDQTTVTIEGASPGASRCEWYVTGGECGITHGEMATDPDGSGLFSATLPVFCGVNVVRVICDNAAGSRVYVRQLAGPVCDGRDLRITLSWDERANDLELHLVREGGQINDPASDCTWFTCVGAPLEWGVADDASDDPSKDIDALGPFGPENIFLTRAAPGTYRVYVEYWGFGEPTEATVAIAIGETTVAELRISDFRRHDVWDVGALSFPDATFTRVDTVVPCQTEWGSGGSRGCGLSLP